MFTIEKTTYGYVASCNTYSAFPEDAELIWDRSTIEKQIEDQLLQTIKQKLSNLQEQEYNYEDWDSEEEMTVSWKPSIEDFEVTFDDNWLYGAVLTIDVCLHNNDDHLVWEFKSEAYEELLKIVNMIDGEELGEAICNSDVLDHCYHPDYDDEESIAYETAKARAAGWVYDPEGHSGYGEWKEIAEETA